MGSGNNPIDTAQVLLGACDGEQATEHSPFHSEAIEASELKALIFTENEEAFREVAKSFTEAERRIKLVEWVDGTDVPSINELRYVSYHLLKAIQHTDQYKQYEELKRAERHCMRASFDALELGMISQLEEVSVFKDDYKDFPVSDVLSGYFDKLAEVQRAQEFLATAAGGEFRDEYYDECERVLGELMDITRAFRSAREEINKKRLLFEEKKERAIEAEQRAKRAEDRADRAENIARKRLWIAVVAVFLTPLITYAFTHAGGSQEEPPESVAGQRE